MPSGTIDSGGAHEAARGVGLIDTAFDLPAFLDRVRRVRRRVLLLDYDGTLAPYSVDRLRAIPYPGVLDLLEGIADDGRTRLAIVTGRFVRELAGLIPLRIEMWGSHGLERLSPDGAYDAAAVPPEARRWVSRAARWIAAGRWAGVLERKPFGFSLHARGAPEAFAEARAAFLAKFGSSAREAGLALRDFDGGLEVRPIQGDKGQVVDRILEEVPPGTPAVYVGDDASDEDAFRRIRGRGLGVLVRREVRATEAAAQLPGPEGVLRFLRWWCGDAGTPARGNA